MNSSALLIDSSNRFLLRRNMSGMYFATARVASGETREFIFDREQLLNFAAWAKVLADPLGNDFNRLVKEIENS